MIEPNILVCQRKAAVNLPLFLPGAQQCCDCLYLQLIFFCCYNKGQPEDLTTCRLVKGRLEMAENEPRVTVCVWRQGYEGLTAVQIFRHTFAFSGRAQVAHRCHSGRALFEAAHRDVNLMFQHPCKIPTISVTHTKARKHRGFLNDLKDMHIRTCPAEM